MIDKELAKEFKKIIENQDWICLSTINSSGMPETRVMINLASPKLFPSLQTFFTNDFSAFFRACNLFCVFQPDQFALQESNESPRGAAGPPGTSQRRRWRAI